MRPVGIGFLGLLLGVVLSWVAVQGAQARQPNRDGTHAGATDSIVGRWETLRKCQDMVRAADAQGLSAIAPAIVGDYFPNATYEELAAKDNLCSGAKPQQHYHFFTTDGFFGSLDQHENQVDDGTYTIVDSDTIRIGDDAVFDYRIDGATLRLTPRITVQQRQEALAYRGVHSGFLHGRCRRAGQQVETRPLPRLVLGERRGRLASSAHAAVRRR